MDKMKPCPWCGHEPIVYERRLAKCSTGEEQLLFPYSVGCCYQFCDVRPQTPFWKYEYEAIHSWNRRVQ